VTAWPGAQEERGEFREAFCTTVARVHAIELSWLPIVQTTVLFRYRVDGSAFRPWAEASGQWIIDAVVEPIEVERFDDLVGHHVQADIEFRAVPNLWLLRDLAVEGPWDFSGVRFQQAKARPT
jgi:hypothetical protein